MEKNQEKNINGTTSFVLEHMNGSAEHGCSSSTIIFESVINETKLNSEEPFMVKLVDSANNSVSSQSVISSKVQFKELIFNLMRCQQENCDPSVSVPVSSLVFPISSSQPDIVLSGYPRLRDSQNRPFMLQPSLFPLQHPTVHFAVDDDQISPVPNEIRSFLRWKMTTITANTMKAIVQRSGYRLISLDKNNRQKSFSNWNAIWCKHLKVTEFALVGYHQRVNHFPGSFNFGRKDRLWLNLKAKADKYGHDIFGSFHPRTFILPCDYGQLLKYWNDSNQQLSDLSKDNDQFGQHRKVFICKPPASARGQGINIVSNIEELNQRMSQLVNTSTDSTKPGTLKKTPKVQLVVQEYISNPCLLHNSAKFDLRVYVLLTSISPLRLYVYEEGIVRFASSRYSKNLDEIKNQFIHLTNYSVNKNSVEYVPSSSTDSEEGHKWTLKTLWRYLAMNHITEAENIWTNIIDLIVKTVISGESQVLALLKQHLKNKRSCFELLGFDIMLDENFKLWLLEVNITPSLRADSVLDFSVKNQLVKDILNTVGYQLSPRFRKLYDFGQHLSPDRSDILNEMKVPNEEKHRQFETLFLSDGFNACQSIINDLNDDDLCQLMESEDELHRCGQFRRIFPSENARQYLPYFDFPYYYNLLLIIWEERYHQRRGEAIARIRSEMVKKAATIDSFNKIKTNIERNEANLNNNQ